MRKIVSLLLLLSTLSGYAQDTITLNGCLDAAVEAAPRMKDKSVLNEQNALLQENIRANWYPSLDLNGKASWQSDVVTIELANATIPIAFPEMPHDQYSLNLDLRQTIYDGGVTRQQKAYEQAKTFAEIKKIEVDLQSVRERVTSLYFAILVAQENRQNLEVVLVNLKAREEQVLAAVQNGAAMERDLKVIRVEILKLLQSLSDIDAAKSGALKMLSTYTGIPMDGEIQLSNPSLEFALASESGRPELEWFDLQRSAIDAGKDLTSTKRLPKVFAFGQAGVGRPGYNMLNDQFDTYYLVGAGVQWKIWDWNTTKREKQIMETKKEIIGNARESFNQIMDAAMQRELEVMDHLKSSLAVDEEILKMRIEITANAASQLDNGVISATDYLLELNNEAISRINRTAHKVKLLQSMANYKLYQGTL